MMSRRLKTIGSNYIGLYAVASSLTYKTIVQGLPIPEQYPPSHVIVPTTKQIQSQLSTPLRKTMQKQIDAKGGQTTPKRDSLTIPSIKILPGRKYYMDLLEKRK